MGINSRPPQAGNLGENMTKKECNGHYNYETWLCGLWIDNDEFLQSTVNDMARNARDVAQLSSEIKCLIEGDEELPVTGLMADLLNAALSEINYDELAEGYLEENKEEPEEQSAEAKVRG